MPSGLPDWEDKAQCELLVDSGSDVSAIQWEFSQSHFKGVKLKEDPPAFQNYDKTSNKGVMGTFETNITVKGKTIPACVYVPVLRGRQKPLLGKPEIKKLRFQFVTMTR